MRSDIKYTQYRHTAHKVESNELLGMEMAEHKAFQSQNFNEEIKTLYTEETHKAAVSTLKTTTHYSKTCFHCHESTFFGVTA